MLVIEGNKENVEIASGTYAPVVRMYRTNGILNITPGVIIQNNKSGNTGGVIYAGANLTNANGGGLATINITGGLFRDNEVEHSTTYLYGGCIYIESGCTLDVENATFDSNKIVQNHTSGAAYGGVIAVRTNAGQPNTQATVTIEGCTFKNTSIVTEKDGGNSGSVLFIGGGKANIVQITDCEFTGNATEGLGGAIYMNCTNKPFELSNCIFSDNTDVNGANDIHMVASTKVEISGETQARIRCLGTEQIHITDTLEAESVIKVDVSDATVGTTVATFASEAIMNACKVNSNIILSDSSYALSYDTASLTATLADTVAMIGYGSYASLADAVEVANALDSATIVLKANVTVDATQTITGNVTITDDGTARTITRGTECTAEMFHVAENAELTFTSSSKDDKNPMLVIEGNKENVEIASGTYAPVVRMYRTNGILNITPGVIIQNNKSGNTGGVIYAGANLTNANGGGLATINITGGLFRDNEVEHSTTYLYGGCIYIESGCTLDVENATFDSNKIVQNHTSGAAYGGVIAVRTNAGQPNTQATVTIEGCTFKNTSIVTEKDGGNSGSVLFIGGGKANIVQITDCEFTGNATEGLGGTIYMNCANKPFELSNCIFSDNTDANGANDIHMVAGTEVQVSGKTQARIRCLGTEQIHITDTLEAESVIKVDVSNATAGATVATFASADIMNACKANGNIILSDTNYLLSYDATNLNATLEDAVIVGEDSPYASLADAIEAANALDSATIVLKANVTVDATQTITGNVTITDDRNARTITRGTECTAQMFDVQEGASLTIVGTGAGTITADGNKVTATASMINNAGTFTLGANASLTNATYPGSSSNNTKGGALYNTGTAILAGTMSGNEAFYGGALYNASGTVSITGGTYKENSAGRGGVLFIETSAQPMTIEGATFSDNTASISGSTGYGGCVYVADASTTQLTVKDAVFRDNTGVGGAVCLYGYSSLKVTGGTYDNNKSNSGILEDVRVNEDTTVTFSGRVSLYVGLNGSATMLVNEALDANSKVYFRVQNTSSITSTKTRDVIEFAEGLMPDETQNIFELYNNQTYTMTFADNKLTLSL